MTIVTRFAPSPTGMLHIGGARTALYCWAYAKKRGKFILRIEDTDLERSTPEAIQAILDGMTWLGLAWNEGPYFQTKRFDRYAEVMQQLIEAGHAYRCYCSKERLDQLRQTQEANKEKPRYDGACRNMTTPQSGSFVVRFKTPQTGAVTVHDAVHGDVTVQYSELDDLIIARADGTPTYNFTVVVDDADMQISHVIRGDDHLNNTFRQWPIFAAMQCTPPQYAHVPMILGEDGKKLSKRHGAQSVMEFRDEGYLPQAVLNYLIRLGWSHGDKEIFSVDEMVELFDITALSKSPAAMNLSKLQWLNQHYMKTLPVDEVAHHLEWHFEHQNLNAHNGPRLGDLLKAQAERAKTLKELVEKSRYFYEDTIVIDEKAKAKFITAESVTLLKSVYEALSAISDWQAPSLHEAILKVAEAAGVKLGDIAQPMRVAVTGNTASPPLDMTLALLGRDKTLTRIQAMTA